MDIVITGTTCNRHFVNRRALHVRHMYRHNNALRGSGLLRLRGLPLPQRKDD